MEIIVGKMQSGLHTLQVIPSRIGTETRCQDMDNS